MTELSAYEFSTLRGGPFTLSRGLADGLDPILVVAPAGDSPPLESLRRLEHELALRPELDADWAARPVELVRRDVRQMLVLEDHGGEPLERLLGVPLDVATFLHIAIPLATALARLHARGLIHKDVKPANVLVNTATDGVWLTGFGIASRFPREHQPPAPPEVIAGTLAYMAPEQTGRMNRSVDSRSDLYSLGVSFYEMLTGALPFDAGDPVEWVHCHIARRPVPPSERVTTVPAQLSSIVLKLLAKTAEDRYQTAAGLAFDLRRCLANWEASGRIDPFTLSTRDLSDRLVVPERLYGREREIGTLVDAFDRVATNGLPELVIVSGYSGIGKSSVVNELHTVVVPPRGLFASGKFDQYTRDIPYATLAQSFQSLVRPLLALSEAELGRWRDALRDALDPNGQLIVNLIPEIEHVIGKQPPVPELAPQDAKHRFQLVFRRLIGVFATPEHPLALFLDDLQWLDAATLELIEHLITHPEVRHLLLVVAYRDNEVSASHPLMRALGAVRKAGAKVQDIVLAPLGLDDVGRLVADSLHAERDAARPLAQLVREKTDGNPFFAVQFLTGLADDGLLVFDPAAPAWHWDIDRIRARSYTDNVVELMAGKLKRLPEATQDALKQLACLGNVAEIATLAVIHARSEEEVHSALQAAVRMGLILRFDDRYAFLHDRVQEAAYALIPEDERAAAHLKIGRTLASRTAAGELDEHIFEIVNQLDRGTALIDAPEERERVAELNLMAAKRAKTSTAYASALTYLAAGRALLAEDSWQRQYELTFSLEYHQAECEFLTGELSAADDRLLLLSRRAGTLANLAAVTCLRVDLFTTLDRSDRAVEVGLEYLQRIGVQWSPHPSNDEVTLEYERIWRRLGSRSIEELIDLPTMTDPEWCATLDVLTIVILPAMFTDEVLRNLIVGRITNLSLEHGNSDGSCFAYVCLGMMLGPRFGDYQAGFRFGRLGYDLVEKRGLHRYQARVYLAFANLVMPWTRHIRSGRDLVRRAFDTANKMGDLTFAAYCRNSLNTNLLATGDPLDEVQREAEHGLDFARHARFGLVVDNFASQLGLIRTLRGETPVFGSFNDGELDELGIEEHLRSDPRLALSECWYWIRKLQARLYAGDYASAVEAASKAEDLLWTSPAFFESAEYHFHGALARAAHYDEASADERQRHLESLAAHHKQLEVWAENCPENFADRAALVGAEIARLEGRDLDAMRLYEQAIRSAREHGFVQNEGLAHEAAARFHAVRGLDTAAHAHRRNARSCYRRWGAEGKVRQLEQLHPRLRVRPAEATSPTVNVGTSARQLDVDTVVKATQALSSEIVLDKLIETLMRLAVEHAGAERGLLILTGGDVPQIEAEATTAHGKVAVTRRHAAVTSSDLPLAALHYVSHTRASLVLDDASASIAYSEDEYVRRHRSRSILCLPIVKRMTLVGALYLENGLTPGAFTSDRVAVLEWLASQAAISLENARLYEDLRRSEASLDDAQQISHTGNWRWNADTNEVTWSAELRRMFGLSATAALPTVEGFVAMVHADDRIAFQDVLARAVRDRARFEYEYRLVLASGAIRYLHTVSRPDVTASGELEYVGVIMDTTERRRAEEALRESQAELARVARLTTMGELAASITHEINQPLAAIMSNGSAGLRWLNRERPDLDEAREALSRVVSDGQRAADVIRGLRALAKKSGPQLTTLDIDAAIRDVLILTRSELQRRGVMLRAELAAGTRQVMGDRVQLQQVLLNLILNGIDAMSAISEPRELTVSSSLDDEGSVVVSVEDTGTGLDPAMTDRVFEPFFTTKPDGLGMGLSICRSIIQAHGGQLWVAARETHGTAFRFALPAAEG